MRHRAAVKRLNRKKGHRIALLRNLTLNLLEHERIRTTVQKAKLARPFAEKLITLGKKGDLHHRRLAISLLGSSVPAKAAVRKLFSEVRERFADRNGGYTRILRLPPTIRLAKADLPRSQAKRSSLYGSRLGDDSTMVLWELCEAEIVKRERAPKKAKRRRTKERQPSAKPKPESAQKAVSAPPESAPAEPSAQPPAAPPPPPQPPPAPVPPAKETAAETPPLQPPPAPNPPPASGQD